MAQTRSDTARFDAFITYSHDADHGLAVVLARRLERVATPWYRRRRLRIFLDRLTLGAQALDGTIRSALTHSRYLIVLASPEAAASRWVQTETGYWLAEHEDGAGRTLVVLTAGHFQWNVDDRRYEADCLPAALLCPGVFTAERKWVDVRGLDVGGGAARDDNLGDAVAELAAELLGTTKDDIRGQEVRARHRARLTLGSALSTLAVFVAALVALTFALQSSDVQATLQEHVARSRHLAAEALGEESPDLAFLLAAQAAKEAPTPEAQDALLQLLNRNRWLTAMRWVVRGTTLHSGDQDRALVRQGDDLEIVDLLTGATSSVRVAGIMDATISSRGDLAILTGTETTLWRAPFARPSWTLPTSGSPLGVQPRVRFTDDGRDLVLVASDSVRLINADGGKLARPPIPLNRADQGCDEPSAAATDDLRLVVVAGCQFVTVWDSLSPALLAKRKIASPLPDSVGITVNGITAIALSPDGRRLAVGTSSVPAALNGSVLLFATRTLEPVTSTDAGDKLALDQHDGAVADLAFDPSGRMLGIAATTPVGPGSRTARFEMLDLANGRLDLLGSPWPGSQGEVIEPGHGVGTFVSGDDQGRVARWDTGRLDGISESLWRGTGGLVAVAATADASVVAVGLAVDKGSDPETGDVEVEEETLLVEPGSGHTRVLERSAITPMGSLPAGGPDTDSTPLVFSPDGLLLLTSQGLRDVHSGRLSYSAQASSGAFSIDGSRVAIGQENGTVLLVTTKRPAVQRVLRLPRDSSPDSSRRVVATSFLKNEAEVGAVSSDGRVVVFDATSGRVLSSWTPLPPEGNSSVLEPPVIDAAFNASGHAVALFRSMTGDVGSYGPADVWDLGSGQSRAKLDDAVSRGDFIDPGDLLMAADTRHALVWWAIGSDTPPRTWIPLSEFDRIGDVRVLNSQSALVGVTGGGGEAEVLRVPLDVQPLAVRACALAGRDFTPEERAQFLPGMTPACR